jgi:hypothetical protein
MAARSSGLFPREGFNLDASCEITVTPTAAATTLANAKTIRVIVIGLAGGDATVTLGGETVTIAVATDLDQNGVGIAHVRGALCDADNNVSYSLSAGSVAGVFYELVDGPRR